MNPDARLHAYARLMRVDRPIGTWLVLWPTLWALWIAGEGHPDGHIVLVFVLGAFLMRGAGCIVNDFADRNIDGHVERTKARPLATGELHPAEALTLFAILLLAAFLLVLTTNRLTILLAIGGAALATLYPFTKRITHWPQLFLGLAFSWAIPMSFAAVRETVPPEAWILVAADCCWVIAYDTIYAMVDRDDDLKIGVKSTAVLFGTRDHLMVGLFQLAFVTLMVWAGIAFGMGAVYFAGLALAALMLGHQQWRIRGRDRDICFRTFLSNHHLGAVVFAAVALDFVL